MTKNIRALRTKNQDSIAIIGIAHRLPGNLSDQTQLWDALLAGCDLVTEVPADRFGTQFHQHDRRDEPGRSVTFKAGVVENIGDFDPAFFGISPREALKIDPQHRLLLELAWHAFEDAGSPPSAYAGTACGVFVGISSTEYGTRTVDDLASMNAYSMLGGTLSIAANRLSYVFDLHGPSLSIDTACSSSLVALHMACESIRRGESETALVGGANLLAHPYPFVGFSHASMLSADGRSKSFSADANGYVRAEGGAVLLLKPLHAAQRDGDRIHAVIRATGTNSDGGSKTGITIPSAEGQTRLLQQVLAKSGVSPTDIDYVEAHGTGTSVGDPIEIEAIGRVYGAGRSDANRLLVGSIKSNIGHMEPASGMAGLIKAVLSLQHREIPPSIHSSVLNPKLVLDKHHIEIVRQPTALRVQDRPAYAAVNSFGFGGTNAHVIIESAPVVAFKPGKASQSLPALMFSAKDRPALNALACAYADLIAANPEHYASVAQAAATQREWMPLRLGVVGASVAEIVQRLRQTAELSEGDELPRGAVLHEVPTAPSAIAPRRCAFVYGGNGAQWQGMGIALMRESPSFARVLRKLDRQMQSLIGFSLLAELKAKPERSRLNDTAVAQPLLFALQVAYTEWLRAQGITAEAYAGHSVGEIAAAWAAGCLSLADAITVVAVRSQAQAKTAGSGRMLATALTVDALSSTLALLDILPESCTIAGFNAPNSLTLSGDESSLLALNAHLEQAGIFSRVLDLDYAFHSEAMAPIADEININLAALSPQAGRGFVSTVTGLPHAGESLNAHYWWRNVREPVQFAPAIEHLLTSGFTQFVEISPHAILPRYISQCAQHKGVQNVQVVMLARKNADTLLDIREAELRIRLHRGVDVCVGQKKRTVVDLPKYPWQRQRYWAQETIEGYNLIYRANVHPLLGYPLKDAPLAWENILDADRVPYLNDHRVDGSVVFPGAAYLELALAAADLGLHWAKTEVRALSILHPLVFEAGQSRTLRTRIFGHDQRFSIQSRRRLSDDDWTEHAIGQLRAIADDLPIDQITQPISMDMPSDARVIDAATHYQTAQALGLDYGASFRGIGQLTVAGNQIRGELALPTAVTEDRAHYLHPAMLDLCFQSLLSHTGAVGSATRQSYLPVQVGRLVVVESGVHPAGFRGRIKRVSAHSVVADFSLHNADGRLIAELRDCRFKAAHFTAANAAPQLWQTQAIVLPSKTTGIHLADHWPSLVADQPALVGSVSRARYFSEIRPLLDALAISCAHESVAELADAQGHLPEYIAGDSALYHGVLGELIAQEYVDAATTPHRLLDAPPSSGDIWTMLNQDYPEANAEATLIARFGAHLKQRLCGQANAADAQAMAEHSALYAQWQVDGLAAQGQHWLRDAFCTQLGQGLAQAGVHRLRVLLVGDEHSDPHQLTQILRAYFPILGVTVFATSPNSEAFSTWVAHDPQNLKLLPWAQCQQQLADGSLGAFDLLWLKGKASLDSALDVDALTKAAAGGLRVIAQPESSTYAAFLDGLAAGGEALAQWQSHRVAGAHMARFAQHAPQTTPCWHEPDDETHSGAALHIASIPAASAAENQTSSAKQPAISAKPLAQFVALNSTGTDLIDQLDLMAMFEPASEDTPAPDCPVILLGGILSPMEDLAATTLDATNHLLEQLQNLSRQECTQPIFILLPYGSLASDSDARTEPVNAALWGMARVAMNEYPALNLYLIDPRGDAQDQWLRTELHRLLSTPPEERELVLDAGRVQSLRVVPAADEPSLSGDASLNRYALTFDSPGQLRNLQWQSMAEPVLGDYDVELKVQAVGLNFRDVMFAMGLLGDEAVENGFSGASLGLECAGIITRVGAKVDHVAVGDAVLGFGPQCFASHVITRGNAVGRMPEHWSFAQAATVPTVFFTVYYALVEMARLRAGERVLIHGGAGGVGIAAIQLAQHLGAEVYATAGSEEKRDFLRLMGVTHIYSSRDLSFADQIMADTQGQGVDVVLNSLAGEAIERNLDVLRPFGRFLELGKRDFYANTPMGLRPFKDNISYFGIDADQLMAARPELTAEVFRAVMALFAEGVLHPLPYLRFSAERVVDAFRSMQQAKHIGKLVVDLTTAPQTLKPPIPACWQAKADASYLVTGGLTGFGFETARWLLQQGAGKVILAARRGVNTPGLAEKLEQLGAWQARVEVVALDVSDTEAVSHLCAQYADTNKTAFPLRGIIHAAMVLDDALMQNLDAERMASVITPKVAGAWHLHQATYKQTLDFFVVYSSVTTVLGNAGQANYVAANAAMESLVRTRRGQGLPGTALLWGPIGDAGYLTEHQHVLDSLEARTGGQAITTAQALDVLARCLRSGESGLAVMSLSGTALQRILPTHSLNRFAYLTAEGGRAEVLEEDQLIEKLKTLSSDEALSQLSTVIAEEVAQVLNLSVTKIDTQRSLFDMGLDSLMAVELALGIEKRLGIRLSAMALNEGPTVTRLAERLLSMLHATSEEDEPAQQEAQRLSHLVQQHSDGLSSDEQTALKELIKP
jgi:acyl transferase domain-containing protein/NADPH:quinone reductase-like Zn-dependent oxidoreductase/NADP-dependent 3-hydroxy acid dehydrogenase YdfG/acyl carrier protein